MNELQNLLSFLPEKWRGVVAAVLCVSPLITRGIYSLMNGGGIRGIVKAIWLGTNTPKPSDTLPASSGSQAGAHNPIPLPLLACLVAPALLFVGCARFTTTQTDASYEQGKIVRQVTTRATAHTLFEAKSSLAQFKASQTDKTQTATVGSLTQESAGSLTNAATAAGEFIGGIIRAAK